MKKLHRHKGNGKVLNILCRSRRPQLNHKRDRSSFMLYLELLFIQWSEGAFYSFMHVVGKQNAVAVGPAPTPYGHESPTHQTLS